MTFVRNAVILWLGLSPLFAVILGKTIDSKPDEIDWDEELRWLLQSR